MGIPTIKLGGVPKWSNGAGCKPVDFGLRKFEFFSSTKLKKFYNKRGDKFGYCMKFNGELAFQVGCKVRFLYPLQN